MKQAIFKYRVDKQTIKRQSAMIAERASKKAKANVQKQHGDSALTNST